MALWLVATPIGTLGDGSPRAKEVLGSASAIYAEDTRTLRKLLTAWGVAAPRLESLHAHNERSRAAAVAARAATEEIALVSDAGTPAISDPGREVVTACHAAAVPILSVPGPSALAAALAASGLPAAPSTFVGFAPRKGRRAWLDELVARPETLVIFEAPARVVRLVADLAARASHREACLCRELSKRFEESIRAPLPDLAVRLAQAEVRGECVLVVGPGEPVRSQQQVELDGAGLKKIASALAERWERPKREVYALLLELERVNRP